MGAPTKWDVLRSLAQATLGIPKNKYILATGADVLHLYDELVRDGYAQQTGMCYRATATGIKQMYGRMTADVLAAYKQADKDNLKAAQANGAQ